ncbi:MAG TPA: Na+/H+ antiporter [Terrimicrobiaceae bacterium]
MGAFLANLEKIYFGLDVAEIELICFLLMIVAVLDIAARKIGLPYPVLLVLSGLALSLIPFLPHVGFNPELALLVFLPPLLYPAALFTSWRDFRRNLRPIAMLAFGLVLMTTVSVAWVAHALIPNLPWAAALILGAIVSPPDAIAATAVLQRIKIPRRIVAILEGESLVNDSIALVAYRFGTAAVVTGSFSPTAAILKVPVVGLGGVFVGWLVAAAVHQLQRRLDDPPVQITISLLTPFAAYLPAEQLGLSGVLAVVTAGLYIGWRSPLMITARTRLEAFSVWRMIVFLLNGIIFILIGLQLPEVVSGLRNDSWATLLWYAVAVSATVVLTRIFWVFPVTYLPRWLSPTLRARDPYPAWQHVAIIGWAGMRGVVSLAAAMALPLTTATGAPFPGRNEIIFLSFSVILVTLVFQGLTLPVLIRVLRIQDDGESRREERIARKQANQAALAFVESLPRNPGNHAGRLSRLRDEYRERLAQLDYCEDLSTQPDPEQLPASHFNHLVREALQVERRTLVELRNQLQINDETLRLVQRDIDLAEARIAEAEH